MNDLHEMAANSREAAWTLAASSLETRNAALLRMAETLENHQADIFAANAADLHQAEADGLAAPLLGRLKFREEKLRAVTDGLRALADLPDPIGATTMTHEITPGLKMYRVTCPIGVIGVIFESRPDALVQIASLALKSGNAVLLKGGREAERTNAALCGALSGFFVAYCGVQPMVVTLGGSFLYSGIALMVSGMSATPAYQGIGGFPARSGKRRRMSGFRRISRSCCIPARTSPRC